MRKLLFFALVCLALAAQAQRHNTPQASPSQTIVQNFGIGTIELSYSRPGLKGRTLGTDLAPYGQVAPVPMVPLL